VDAAKGMVAWAKENAALSGLADKPVRYIVDDCLKFVKREQRREKKYDGIIMDPPSFGRGPGGEVWKAETDLFPFVVDAAKLLSDDALFFHINSYTTGFSPVVLENMLKLAIQKNKFRGSISCGELVLPVSNSELFLPCGIFARWQKD
jgi:23S rRNA (cytosine1962-C5)-methyltransferase